MGLLIGTRLASGSTGAAAEEPAAPADGCDAGAPVANWGEPDIIGPAAYWTTSAPRLSTTRLSPSRRSTVFRSLALINCTICSSSPTSIGPEDRAAFDEDVAVLD